MDYQNIYVGEYKALPNECLKHDIIPFIIEDECKAFIIEDYQNMRVKKVSDRYLFVDAGSV